MARVTVLRICSLCSNKEATCPILQRRLLAYKSPPDSFRKNTTPTRPVPIYQLNSLIKAPFVVLGFSSIVMWLAARIGLFFRKRQNVLEEGTHEDFDLVVGAILTLLGLIIGFSFSMAISRYEQRKNYEEAEANAIGTEYVRADLLPAADAARVRELLKEYANQRILFDRNRDEHELEQINARIAQLQSDMWSVVRSAGGMQATPILALAISGMNDVLNSQGYTQAAWWNRIPPAAWFLMWWLPFAPTCCWGGVVKMLVIPLVLSIAFLAIADIDSPRRGVIRVVPQNLISLAGSLNRHLQSLRGRPRREQVEPSRCYQRVREICAGTDNL